jgi:phenylalanine-4-hydroxylase
MDTMGEINTDVIEAESLSLPSNHPGREDIAYLRRRNMFFYVAREHRLRGVTPPKLPYTEEEATVWRATFNELDELHQRAAASIFLEGKRELGLTAGLIPDLAELERILQPRTGVRLIPAEGLLHGKIYFKYWAERIMPCTLFLRHHVQPKYTPEPDIIHDVIGHVPPLMDPEYVGLIELIGRAAQKATPEQLEAIVRFYWFTVEFGLIREAGEMKILGAGILSSIGETEHVLSGKVEVRPFSVAAVTAQSFDTTVLQPVLFLGSSLDELVEGAREFVARLELSD